MSVIFVIKMRCDFFNHRLGGKICFFRKSKNLSQEQLALLSAIDRTYLARIEEGKANPSIKILNRIAHILDVKVNHLVDGI